MPRETESHMMRLAGMLEEALDDAEVLQSLDYELVRLRAELERVFRRATS